MRFFDVKFADIYSRVRPTYPAELYYWLSQQVSSPGVAWDCGCGTGQASIDLAAYFERVEASDINESQITQATPHRKIHYQVCPAETTPYPDDYFDMVCVAHAIHWFDLAAFWQEVCRVLKPGGVFVCWGYNGLEVGELEDKVITQHIFPHLESYWPTQNNLLWDEYRSVQLPFDILEVPPFELTCYWSLTQMLDFIRSWSASQLRIQDCGDDFLLAADEILRSIWIEPSQKKGIRLPFFVKAGRMTERLVF